MKILVTGGLGFIGSHLVDHYLERGHEVSVIDDLSSGRLERVNPKASYMIMSLSDPRLKEYIQDLKPDVISHHAAQVNVRLSTENPLHDMEINLKDTVLLLQAAGAANIKKFIFASSGGAAYGELHSLPISEKSCCKPISPYGIHKLASEHYVMTYAKSFRFQWTILRYSNVYGPRQGESGVIPLFIARMRLGIPPIIFGDGEQVRDFVHIDDVVAANMLVSGQDTVNGEVFNVGTGRGTSLNYLVKMLMLKLPEAAPPEYAPAQPGDLLWNVLSIKKLTRLGWSPKVEIKDGIMRLID